MGSIYTLNQALDKVQELYDKRYTLEEAIKIVKKVTRKATKLFQVTTTKIIKNSIPLEKDLDKLLRVYRRI